MGLLKAHPFWLNVAVLLAALVLSVAVGAVFVPPHVLGRILISGWNGAGGDWPAAFQIIVFRIRLPHTALVALTGAALGGSGAAYQGLFRNPLADPYLIGVASGAGLGAVVAMAVRWPENLLGLYAVPVAAFVGAALTVALVYALAYSPRSAMGALPTTTLILAGVAVGSFASALTSYLMLRSEGELRRALAWLLGGATMSGWAPALAALPYIAAGLLFLLSSGHALNVLQYGDEQARHMGLAVTPVRTGLLLAASLTTAAAVSFSGVIGFVGLITPHLARLLWGADYRRLVPLSILGGASMLLLADILSRIVLAPQELPVGVVTALAGAPFFLWVLRRSQVVRDA